VSDQLEVLKTIAKHLDVLDTPYMVTGSLAASYYAVPRFTRDIDIVVEVDTRRAVQLAHDLADEFYVDEKALLRAVARSGMANIIHQRLLVKVDLIVRKDTPYRREELVRRRSVVLDGVTVWLVTPEDLILSKLLWMRESRSEIQRRDVESVLASVQHLDRQYIERWATELNVLGMWREASSAAE